MKLFILFLSVGILTCAPAVAQLVQNDIGTHSMILRGTKTEKVSTSNMNLQGKYLWSKDWHRGSVMMKPGNTIKMKALKLNFYTNEIQYPDGAEEMAASIENMSRIVVFSNEGDSTAVAATFVVLRDPETKRETFFEVMNEGNVQLLKQTKVGTNKMKVDPILAQSETIYFYPTSYYFIRKPGKLIALKSLGKSNVLGALPEAASETGWLTENKNKLRKEEDVVVFLKWWNAR